MGLAKAGGGASGPSPRIHTISLGLLFPLSPVNIYMIDGDVPTLVDTGLDTDVAWLGLVEGLRSVGRSPRDIRRVVLTHGHIDHVGLCPRLLAEGSPEIMIHAHDAGRVRSDVEYLVGLLEKNSARFKMMGITARDVDRLFRSYISVLRRFHVGPFPVTEIVDGQQIECGDSKLTVIHTPGHTSGSACFSLDTAGVLFSGDHVMEGTSTNPLAEMIPEEGVGLVPYIASLKRIGEIAPETILPGHGATISRPDEFVSRITFHHDTTGRRVSEVLDTKPVTPAALSERLFPEFRGIAAGSAVFEVFCHLTELVDRGEAAMDEREGLYYYRRVG